MYWGRAAKSGKIAQPVCATANISDIRDVVRNIVCTVRTTPGRVLLWSLLLVC